MKLRISVLVAACSVSLFSFGCSDEPAIVARDTGYLTVNWTIGNERTAELCKAYNAYGAEILIADTAGLFVTEIEVPCNQFDASIELVPDDYSASIVLVSEDDRTVSSRLDLGTFVVRRDAEVTLDASFAAPPP